MADLRKMAFDALNEAERPMRDKRERENKLHQERVERGKREQELWDTRLLKASPLVEWFPGVEFVVHDHLPSPRDGTVFEYPQEGPHLPIRFLVVKANRKSETPKVYFTPVMESDHAGRRFWAMYARDKCESAVDVGRMIRSHEEAVHSSEPDHMP